MANTKDKSTEKTVSTEEIDRLVDTPGSIVFLILLPLVLQFAWLSCNDYNCDDLKAINALYSLGDAKKALLKLFPIPNQKDILFYLGFIAAQWLLHIILPGKKILGYPISWDGSKLEYKLNGLLTTIISMIALVGSTYLGYFNPSFVVDRFGQLAVTAHAFAYALSLILYFKGVIFRQGNPTGKLILDFFYGYEPNPRFLGIRDTDVKWFSEGRALTTWLLIDMCLLYKQFTTTGQVTIAMSLIFAMHFIYVIHYMVNEFNVLAMVDFTAENMGWMLTWGNFVWVSFSFCLQCWCALKQPKEMGPISIISTILLFGVGYAIFGQANLQRHGFRSNPSKPIWGKIPRYIKAENGKLLLTSGWWGIARKINYTGDLIMAWVYGLPCLTIGMAPFLYAGYLTVLLIHRANRDNEWCKMKYGRDWDRYCKEVPYMLIPGLY